MKYIAFYDTNEYLHEQRSVALCAANVTTYMLEVLEDFTNVEVISPSRTRNKSGFYQGRKTKLTEKSILIQPPTFGVKTRIGRVVAIAYTLFWLFFYLLNHTKKGEIIIAYHSLATMMPLRLIKKFKKINLVLEVREFYSDARQSYEEFGKDKTKLHKKELKFFHLADKYIFPTELLNQIVNTQNKPYVIAPGIYKSEENKVIQKWNDGKIHVVYAGTLRESKGVYDAIRVAAKLPHNYHVHILGNATEDRLNKVKNEVEKVSKESQATVSYDGQLRGDEFLSFLQKCHIGLSPQAQDASFNETSFPSKIFTYFANGLDVVSVRIPAIEQSPVGSYIHYYDGTIESMAKCIQSIDPGQTSSKKDILTALDCELKQELKELVES